MAPGNQSKYTSKLKGKRVLVFGATSGIGAAVAEAAAEYGAEVIVSGSNQGRIDSTIARLQAAYPESPAVTGFACDLADSENVEANLTRLFETVTDGGKRPIHHIAFTAGTALKLLPLKDYTISNLFDGAKMRLPAVVFIAKLAPAYMSKEIPGEASITITGGTVSSRPLPNWTVMAGWAASAEGLMRGLAVALAPAIRVGIVAPGGVDTPLLRNMDAAHVDQVLAAISKGTLVGRIGQPEDVAEAYIYLMKDRFATGQIVTTDGGRLLV